MFETDSKTIAIESGVNAIGIYTTDNINIDSNETLNPNIVKTIVNSNWKSWTKDTPIAYQGFENFESGLGYVVVTPENGSLNLNGDILDIKNITPVVGISSIALPFPNKKLKTQYIGKMKVFNVRTYDGGWKSWTENTPEEFQGFVDIDYKKGYIVDVADVNADNLDVGIDTTFAIEDWGAVVPIDPYVDNGFYKIVILSDWVIPNTTENIVINTKTYLKTNNTNIVNNIAFNSGSVVGLIDSDLNSVFIDITPEVNPDSVYANLFTINDWGNAVKNITNNTIKYVVYGDMENQFLDNEITGVIDSNYLPEFISGLSSEYITDPEALFINIAHFNYIDNSINIPVNETATYMKTGNNIIFKNDTITGLIDSSYSAVFIDTSSVVDNTAVMDTFVTITNWGEALDVIDKNIGKTYVNLDLNQAFITKEDENIVFDQELLYNSSNINLNFT